jgi:chemotaxis protein CheD
MTESELAQPEVFLQPGEIYLANQPTIIATILGSCIGVTFWCSRLGIGALCHAILPKCPRPIAGKVSLAMGDRYVDFCVWDLARQFDSFGARRSEVEVKVFGGADVLAVNSANARPTVGSQNSQAAVRILADEGFHVIASSTGDVFGRKIRFDTGSGEVRLVRLV